MCEAARVHRDSILQVSSARKSGGDGGWVGGSVRRTAWSSVDGFECPPDGRQCIRVICCVVRTLVCVSGTRDQETPKFWCCFSPFVFRPPLLRVLVSAVFRDSGISARYGLSNGIALVGRRDKSTRDEN